MRDVKTVREALEWMKSRKVDENLPSVLACRKLHRRAVSQARKKLERLKARNARPRRITRAEAKLAKAQQTMENRRAQGRI